MSETPPVKIVGYTAETVIPYSLERVYSTYRALAREHGRKDENRLHYVWNAMSLREIRKTRHIWSTYIDGREVPVIPLRLHGKLFAWFSDGRCAPVKESTVWS